MILLRKQIDQILLRKIGEGNVAEIWVATVYQKGLAVSKLFQRGRILLEIREFMELLKKFMPGSRAFEIERVSASAPGRGTHQHWRSHDC